MMKLQILTVSSFTRCSVYSPSVWGAPSVLLEGFGEKVQWKIREAFPLLVVFSNCDVMVKNPGYTDYAKV